MWIVKIARRAQGVKVSLLLCPGYDKPVIHDNCILWRATVVQSSVQTCIFMENDRTHEWPAQVGFFLSKFEALSLQSAAGWDRLKIKLIESTMV